MTTKDYKGAIQEKRFEYKGYQCVVVMQCGAFRTGYVGLPLGHKYYGESYYDIPIRCHGGLTYSSNKLIDQTDDNMWWIGFDTAHYRDGHDYDGALELFKDYPKSVELITATRDVYREFWDDFEAFSLDDMIEELVYIVEQLEVQNNVNN